MKISAFERRMFSCCLLLGSLRCQASARIRPIRDDMTCHLDDMVRGTVVWKQNCLLSILSIMMN